MLLLKKIFKLRDQSGGQSAEKPFMEHLEDFRDLIVRVVLTLAIATIACYVFRDTLLDVLRRPIEQVWVDSEQSKLPKTISPDTWEKAKMAAERTAGHSPEQLDYFYSQFPEKKLRYYAECATYYRSALVIKDLEKRKEYIKDIPGISDEKRELITTLLDKKPSASINARGDVVFMRSLKPTETFMLALKLSVFAGIIISFPLILFFILQFVVPGLKPKERKALYPALLIGFGLFLGGVFFCYFSVLPKALDFFFSYGKDMGVENEWRIGEYISFTTQFTLIFGLSFELPVVVMTLNKIGLLSYETMRNTRSYAIITIMVVAAVITPTGDALTLSMLAVPMIILYEICIWLAYFSRKKELAAEAEELEEIRAYQATLDENGDPDDDDDPDSDPDGGGYVPDNDGAGNDEDYYPEDHSDDAHPGRQTPRIAPVPGRVPTDADHEFIEDDYDDEYRDDYHHHHHYSDDEGEEMDDGEIEPYDPADVYTQDDEDNHVDEDAEQRAEQMEKEQLTEDALNVKEDNLDALDDYEEEEIDFNPGATFEDDHRITDESELDEADAEDDESEKSDKAKSKNAKQQSKDKNDKQDPPKQK